MAGHSGTFASALLAAAIARGADDKTVDDYVQAQMQKQRIPGLSLAVLKNGELVQAKGYGLANVELKVPATADTIYQSGSVGKQFTATAVMMLVEEGKIGLDLPLSKYFSDAPQLWKDITVRHLLTHTSGIKDYTQKDVNFRQDYTTAELLKIYAAFPLDFPPGEKWSYSNTGYALLGFLIEKVTGKFYGDFLQERVFQPLGMATARVISEADIVLNRASGYRLVDGALKNQEWVSPTLNTTADGALYLSVRDLSKWDAGLHAGGLLKKTTLGQMWAPVRLNNGNTYPYGFGWRPAIHRGHDAVGHGGSWQGFRTHIERYAEDGLTVIVLTNLAQAEPEGITYGVAGLYNPAYLPPALMKTEPDPHPSLTERLKQFLLDYGEGNGKDEPLMAPGLTAITLATWRASVKRALKDARSFSFIAGEDVAWRDLVRNGASVGRLSYYKLVTPSNARYYTFFLTNEDKIADLESYPE